MLLPEWLVMTILLLISKEKLSRRLRSYTMRIWWIGSCVTANLLKFSDHHLRRHLVALKTSTIGSKISFPNQVLLGVKKCFLIENLWAGCIICMTFIRWGTSLTTVTTKLLTNYQMYFWSLSIRKYRRMYLSCLVSMMPELQTKVSNKKNCPTETWIVTEVVLKDVNVSPRSA